MCKILFEQRMIGLSVKIGSQRRYPEMTILKMDKLENTEEETIFPKKGITYAKV